MSSEQHVEDLLSPYLDNALTPDEYASVATHLQICSSCNEVLADFRYFDTLLKQQPRVRPRAVLRERIFSSPAFIELVDENTVRDRITHPSIRSTRETMPQKQLRFDHAGNENFTSTPGTLLSMSQQITKANLRVVQTQKRPLQRVLLATLAAGLLLAMGLAGLVGWSILQTQNKLTRHAQGIVAPQDLTQGGPLPAGMRFIFLQGGSLWSAPEDAKASPVRLTPPTVDVAAHWVVRPAQVGHRAGNLIAYIDLKQGAIHLVRSDGQSDTIIRQPLLARASVSGWNTAIGSTILSSLTWSPDGNTLAFIASVTGVPALYLYPVTMGQMQTVALPDNGVVSHLVWAPDSVRLAFKSTHNNTTSILDYNIQTRTLLVVAPAAATTRFPGDGVVTLDWAASTTAPAITWSVGTPGHIHSVWIRKIGVSVAKTAESIHTLISGDYTQAVYDRVGARGNGAWILTRSITPTSQRLLTLTLDGTFYELVSGGHIEALQWLVDGTHVSYIDGTTTGILHLLDATNGSDTIITSAVQSRPMPVWASDGQQVAYSTGVHTVIVNIHSGTSHVSLPGVPSMLLWSKTDQNTLLVVLTREEGAGVQVQQKHEGMTTIISLSVASATPVVWTQIP